MTITLSKSKYLVGLQCPKLLWVVFNAPERIPEVDQATQHVFDQGHLVGELAKSWFPSGVELGGYDFKENLVKTKEALRLRKPLFEAGLMQGNIFARADILNPVGKDEWDIIEVKSSASVKEVHYHDLSFQKYCYKQAGLKIRKCFLMHINTAYVRHGKIDPKQLFVMEDTGVGVDNALVGIKERIDLMFKIISLPKCPEIKISASCSGPYDDCSLHEECWAFVPKGSVFELWRGGKKTFELLESSIVSLIDIPDGFKLNDNQRIQKECYKNGKHHVNKQELKVFLDSLKYPLCFLDFETINPAVPLYDNSSSYENIPFQFSLHVQEKPNGEFAHHSFLAEGKDDPRPALLSALKKVIGGKGSIVAYNASFEKGVLKDLAEAFSKDKEWIESLLPRIVDLMTPFSKFYYYHPKQQNSASLKSVLPILTGKGYDDLDIAEGGTASLEYLRITFGDDKGKLPSTEEIKKVRKNLEEYCLQDTEGLTWILAKLRQVINDEK